MKKLFQTMLAILLLLGGGIAVDNVYAEDFDTTPILNNLPPRDMEDTGAGGACEQCHDRFIADVEPCIGQVDIPNGPRNRTDCKNRACEEYNRCFHNPEGCNQSGPAHCAIH